MLKEVTWVCTECTNRYKAQFPRRSQELMKDIEVAICEKCDAEMNWED